MALTSAQMLDVRRYAGYPLYGTAAPLTNDQDTVYMRFGLTVMSLQKRLTSLSADEETVLTTKFLAFLATLETDIPGTAQNLDTDQASVWYHNKNEMGDRVALFNKVRRDMCAFIGVAPGPGLGDGGMRIVRG